jgi:acyl-CoA thioester hydrolase
MEKKKEDFRLLFRVRDYECDLQGIVNNAHYQHYWNMPDTNTSVPWG